MKNRKLKTLFITVVLMLSVITQAQNAEFWGMTTEGGVYNQGAIFKTDSEGDNQSVGYSFQLVIGKYPKAGLCVAGNGKFYGVTSSGLHSKVVLFEYDPVTSTYLEKLEFDVNTMGGEALGSLVEASNGKLYGMTSEGGVNDLGVLFEYDPINDIYTKKVDFNGTVLGGHPHGSLIEVGNGKLYGMTSWGGVNDLGVLFEYDLTTNIYTKKLDFDGGATGSHPEASLLVAGNGKLYGVTSQGGVNDLGVLFEYDPTTNTYTKKLDFDGSATGSYPYGSLIEVGNGKLYGMTSRGGVNGYGLGVLFEYDLSADSFSKKLDFDGSATGSYPYGTLMEVNNKLYGMTSGGGVNNDGVLFEYDPINDIYTKKLDFDRTDKGTTPKGFLIEANNTKLYGVTEYGGVFNEGVLFEYDFTNDAFVKKLDFGGSVQGYRPYGSLLLYSNGKLYGMASMGGIYNKGVLFECNPITGEYSKKLDFDGIAMGSTPTGSLFQTSSGDLYGVTTGGGINDKGVLFEYDPVTNVYTKMIDFGGSGTGSYPVISLMEASNDKLYGVTSGDASNDDSVLFEYDPSTNVCAKKFDFDGVAKGSRPSGPLVEVGNGKLYGTTEYGGVNDDGVLFEYDIISGIYSKKIDFDWHTVGNNPIGTLVQADNGKLYGMVRFGGNHNGGILFEYDPTTNIYTKKIHLDWNTTGIHPFGSLTKANNGKLYGMTLEGGANGLGVLFEYDPSTGIATKKLDFDGANGAHPFYNHLIEINTTNGIVENDFGKQLMVYPNPNHGNFAINFSQVYNNIEVTISDLNGKLVYSNSFTDAETVNISIKEVPAGVYLARIQSGEKKAVIKLIKE